METRFDTRTLISEKDAAILHYRLEKVKTYEQTRRILNNFVAEQLGMVNGYGFEDDGTGKSVKVIYKNSNNPGEVKQCVCDVIGELSGRSKILNDKLLKMIGAMEKSTEYVDDVEDKDFFEHKDFFEQIFMKGKSAEYLEKTIRGGKFAEYLEKTIQKNKSIAEWSHKWNEEPAFNIDDWDFRLRPMEGASKYIAAMRQKLIEKGLFDEDANVETWNYICGISDEEPVHPIKFNGSNLHFAVLLDNFFAPLSSKGYFEYKKGKAAQQFVTTFFLNRNGKPMKYASIKSERCRSGKKDLKIRYEDKSHAVRSYEIWNDIKINGMI